jgi:hypothetical protein
MQYSTKCNTKHRTGTCNQIRKRKIARQNVLFIIAAPSNCDRDTVTDSAPPFL